MSCILVTNSVSNCVVLRYFVNICYYVWLCFGTYNTRFEAVFILLMIHLRNVAKLYCKKKMMPFCHKYFRQAGNACFYET